MQNLSPIRMGLSVATASAFFYVGCIAFMAIAPHDTITWISNSLLHGVDVSSVQRENVPWLQSTAGVLLTFAGAFVFGFLLACVYNLTGSRTHDSGAN